MPLRIPDFAIRVKTVLGNWCSRAIDAAANLRVRLQLAMGSLLEKVPPEHKRFILPAAIGVLAVLVLIFIVTLLPGKGETEGREAVAANYAAPRRDIIPIDDMFLPDEPDFVPGVMPEREKRTAWTADDVETLWQDPLKNGEELWRNRIEQTIDELMESVP